MKNKIQKLENISEIQKRFNHTYLHGVYLAINAIAGAYLVVDGPACIFDKIDFIYKTHDLYSDLIRRDASHRICSTGVQADQTIVIDDRSERISQLLHGMGRQKDCSAIFISSVPMATITGTQYDLIINRLQKKIPAPMIEIPSKSLHGDWLLGYEETLISIAKKMKFKTNRKKPNNVGIVGYFFDRNEGDHTGNIKELTRMLKGISLDLVSVWLSGCSFSRLQDIEKAQFIISLPYGRGAAREIAGKTQAELIELDLPLGLENTKQWLRQIARKINKSGKAELFIDRELKEIIPGLSIIVPEYLMNKKVALNGEPYLICALASSIEELGGSIDHMIMFSRRESAENYVSKKIFKCKTFYEASYSQVFSLSKPEKDLFIGNSHIFYLLRMQNIRKPYVEIGYPSFYHHCFVNSPFLGFKGYVHLLNRIVNSLLENG